MNINKTGIEIIGNLFLFFTWMLSYGQTITINCKANELINNTMIGKNVLLLIMIRYIMGFYDTNEINEIDKIKYTLMIYTFYILMTKQTFEMFIINTILILIIYMVYSYTPNNNILKYFEYVLFGTIIIGTLLYMKKQYDDRLDKFNIIKFFFGTHQC